MNHPLLTDSNGSRQFQQKTAQAKQLINEALEFLSFCGIPVERETPHGMEKIALAFLAVADVRPGTGWSALKTQADNRSVRTRDIINYINTHYGENISSGSYDDIRRQSLLWPVMAGVVVQTAPSSARNAPNRGYALEASYGNLARQIGIPNYRAILKQNNVNGESLREQLLQYRETPLMSVMMSDGSILQFTPGQHNELQKAIIEEFLPRYGFEAKVLYVGDAANKSLHYDVEALEQLRFFNLDHGELPDIVAYSERKQWIYLIEAFYSTGPMSIERVLTLKSLTRECTVPIVYVTAFMDRNAFRSHAHEIAWETEVWIASEPDHLIHYNGDKFLGPHITGS